ncbi:hypothetical protein FRC02_003736 [Tulasnella sp. 418]|nr:hypothetical protein FRC02_003736 [Tulasnella sp. 418]
MGFTCVGQLEYCSSLGFEALSLDGKYVAASDGSRRIVIWEVDKPVISPFKSLVPPNASWRAITGSWSSMQQYFMAVYRDAGIGVWDVEAGTIIRFCSDEIHLPIHFTGTSICVYRGFLPESIHIVDTSSMSGTSIEVGEFIDFALTPDLQRVVLLNEESLKVYNINGKCEFVIDKENLAVSDNISISKDGKHVLISHGQTLGPLSIRWTADLWEIIIENGKALLYHIRRYFPSDLTGLNSIRPQFGGPQDAMIVAVSNGTLSIWDRYSDKLLYSSSLAGRNVNPVIDSGYRMSFQWNTTDPRDMVLVVGGHVYRGLPRA